MIEVEETCSLLPLPRVGPIPRSEEAPGARATQARGYGDQQRQGSAGGGGEDATAGGVDRRVRVPAQAPGGQPLPTAIPGTTTLSFPRWTRFVPPCRRPCPFLASWMDGYRIQIQLRTRARANFFHMLNQRCWITKLRPERVLAAVDRGKSGEFCVQFWCSGLA